MPRGFVTIRVFSVVNCANRTSISRTRTVRSLAKVNLLLGNARRLTCFLGFNALIPSENATDVSNGNDTLSSIPHTLSTESTTTTTTTTTTSAQLPSSSFANFDYAISWGNESFVEENSTAEDCLNYDAAFYENLDTSTLE